MDQEAMRRAMAAAVRTVLEEGVRKAEDPVAFLRTASREVRELVAMFERTGGQSSIPGGAAIRAMLAEEVEAIAAEMIRRLHH
ncbi:hypothetical protein [Muricoccus vinaceus]|uniref:Uncharacterized protein n=1 Tax=Muricoccus vinaceus TaxID=424704 RepID=A0ABV6J039_9PROT